MNMITDPREHLVVIGNGMAGMRVVEELLKLEGGQRFRITVFGAEPHVNYNPNHNIADVDKMLTAARTHKRAGVIGGGLLGLEAAWGLKQRGMSVALIHLMPTLMERQLDAAAGQMLRRDLDRRGVAFFTDGQTEEITGTDHAEGVQLADGRFVPADLVVLAIGIRPNID